MPLYFHEFVSLRGKILLSNSHLFYFCPYFENKTWDMINYDSFWVYDICWGHSWYWKLVVPFYACGAPGWSGDLTLSLFDCGCIGQDCVYVCYVVSKCQYDDLWTWLCDVPHGSSWTNQSHGILMVIWIVVLGWSYQVSFVLWYTLICYVMPGTQLRLSLARLAQNKTKPSVPATRDCPVNMLTSHAPPW